MLQRRSASAKTAIQHVVEESLTMRSRRWLKRSLLIGLITVPAWVLGDFVYSRIISHRINSWEQGVERDADGIRLGCREYTLGKGPSAVLLIHGINDSPAAYGKLAPELAKSFTCRVMRLPGFAMPVDQYAKTNRQQWIAAVDTEVAKLAEDHSQVHIVAHSLGGAVTVRYLVDRPNFNGKVVLIAPAFGVSNDRSPVLSTRTWHTVGSYLLWFTRITESPFGLDARGVTDEEYPWRTPFAPRTLFDETFALIDENRDRASDITPPLMMILAKDDHVIDVAAARRFYEEVPSEDKQIVLLEHSGHAVTIDNEWRLVAEEIAAFLRDG